MKKHYKKAKSSLSPFCKTWGVWLLMAGFSCAYSTVVLLRHWHFESLWDLSIFDQEIWLLSRNLPPLVTARFNPMIIWGDHYTVALTLLSPLFKIINRVEMILLAQVFIVVSGAWPLYQLAEKHTRSIFFALSTSFTYLAYVGLQNALVFDFHAVTLAAGLFAWLFWCSDEQHWGSVTFLIIVILHLKEDLTLMIAALGLYLILRYRRYRLGAVVTVTGLAWFFLVTTYLIPSFQGSNYSHTSAIPRTLDQWIWVVTGPPEKLRTLFYNLLPFGFLPAFSLSTLPMTGIHYLIHFLDPKFAGRWGLALHYRAPLTPILAVGTVWAVSRFRRLATPIALWMIAATLFNQVTLHLPLNGLAKPALYRSAPWMSDNRLVMSGIPPDASLAAQANLLPHLTHRREISLFEITEKRYRKDVPADQPHPDSPCGTAVCALINADNRDYLMLDLHPGQPIVNFWATTPEHARAAVDNTLKTDPSWRILKQRRNAILLYKYHDQSQGLP